MEQAAINRMVDLKNSNRIDPSITDQDEQDGQRFFDAVFALDLAIDEREALEAFDYPTAARMFRAVRAA